MVDTPCAVSQEERECLISLYRGAIGGLRLKARKHRYSGERALENAKKTGELADDYQKELGELLGRDGRNVPCSL